MTREKGAIIHFNFTDIMYLERARERERGREWQWSEREKEGEK